MIEIIAVVLLAIFFLVGFIVSFLGIPGPAIITAGYAIYALILKEFSWPVFLFLAGLSALSEILDFLLVMVAGKKFGASKKALFGAAAGGIIGAIIGVPFPIIGSLLGLFIGLFLGAFITESIILKNQKKALRAALGVFIGRLGALIAKVAISVINIIIIVRTI